MDRSYATIEDQEGFDKITNWSDEKLWKEKNSYQINVPEWVRSHKRLVPGNLHNVSNDEMQIEIQEYAPKAFHHLRKTQGITLKDIMKSMALTANTKGIKNFTEGAGKSASFFFFTDDRQFVIKTVKSDEVDILMGGLLKNYHQYINGNPSTLISRYYGLLTIKIK
jgi:hypothetical protein